MNKYVSMALTFVDCALITGGGAYINAAGNGAPITPAVVVGAIVLGLVQAAKAIQDLMRTPPT